MVFQGAETMEALYFQLYLLSLGYDGLLSGDAEYRSGVEPYATLDGHFNYLWEKATEQFEHEGKGCLEEFLSDENIIHNADMAVFLVEFTELLTRDARHFDHTQPEEISELVCRLSGFQKGMSVYNPYAGFGSYATAFQAGDDYYGEEFDLLSWGIGVLKMHMDGSSSANYVYGDSLNPSWKRRFDIVVSTPPYFPLLSGPKPGSRRMEGYEQILNDLPALLEEKGSCIIVSNASILNARAAGRLLNSSMLDMIAVLPDWLMYHTASVQVLVRLKRDREPDAPILMVDARDFYVPGGRMRKVLDVKRILHTIQVEDSRHVVLVPLEAIRKTDCVLFPDVYLARENYIEGLTYVPVNSLGTVFHPKRAKLGSESQLPFVSVRDLSPSPTHIVTPSAAETRASASVCLLTAPALLMIRNSDSLKFGYVADCSPESPVYVSEMMMAFVPNEELVSWEYVAAALSEATLSNMGSSAFRLTFTDFAVTMIPLLPKREQAQYVKRILRKNSPRRDNAIKSTRKIPVILVGLSGIEDRRGRISVLRHFERMNDAKDWLSSHPTAAEAVIAQVGSRVTASNVSSLCERFDTIPVFIIAPDLEKLEEVFHENCIEYDFGERAFSSEMVDDLVDTLAEVADQAMTLEGDIRRRYRSQLDDAGSLDNVFRYENVILRDELEELLVKLSRGDVADLPTRMRKMRDNCFLQPLIDYGFLPNDIRWDGALIDLLAERNYRLGDDSNPSRIILNREILPVSVARLLQTMSKAVLNPGSHDYGLEDGNTLMACLCVLMAALETLADMVDRGNFKDRESQKGYFSIVSPAWFKSGMYEVRRMEDVKGYDYLYAGNVHLDNKTCRENGIKAGDIVQIDWINGFEKEPRIDDFVQVYFYSREFSKVEQ